MLLGRVDVASGRRPGQAAPDSDAALRARIAEELEASMRVRAGVGDHHLNQLPSLVSLPDTTTLDLGQIPQTDDVPDLPVVILNLRTHADAAAVILNELEANGFPRNRNMLGGGPWAMSPGKWSHLCWPSQILLMGEDKAGARAKLIFEAFPPSGQWYDLVRNHRMAALGFLIYNDLEEGRPNIDSLERASSAGDLIAFVAPGMCAS